MKIRAQYKSVIELAKAAVSEMGSFVRKDDFRFGLAMLESACNKGDINLVHAYTTDEREPVRVAAQTIFNRHIINARKAALAA